MTTSFAFSAPGPRTRSAEDARRLRRETEQALRRSQFRTAAELFGPLVDAGRVLTPEEIAIIDLTPDEFDFHVMSRDRAGLFPPSFLDPYIEEFSLELDEAARPHGYAVRVCARAGKARIVLVPRTSR